MSAGAVFKLIANDGKADRLIMATQLLNQRIKDVMCARSQSGGDQTPTLIDIERTHILYVNAHFKPFAAVAFEYNKVRTTSGSSTFGGSVQFSIPQFGDFFYDMVIRTRIAGCDAVTQNTPLQSAASGAVFPMNTVPSNLAATGDYTTYNIVDTAGKVIVTGLDSGSTPTTTVAYKNYVRYCEFPGNQLFTSVKFEVNGNPLDQYDELVITMLEKFCIPTNKRTGYNRLVGQEVPLPGYGALTNFTVTDSDANTTQGTITRNSQSQSQGQVALHTTATGGSLIGTLISQPVAALATASATQYDVSRQLKYFVNGPQTPKPAQAPLELWNKLRFWFNDDVRLSIASVSIPFGQRFISVDICPFDRLAYEVPSIYLETTVSTHTLITAAGYNASAVDTPQKVSVTSTRTYSPIFQKAGLVSPAIDKMELYINNIFVNPEIHDIYIKRIGFSLIRVYREHVQRCNTSGSDEKLLSQLKWPIEYLFVGLRPTWNIDPRNPTTSTDWHRCTRQLTSTDNSTPSRDQSYIPAGLSTSDGARSSTIGSVMPDTYGLSVPTVDTLTLTTHGIKIFDEFTDTFFNQYLPFQYGGPLLNTPEDVGVYFVNMALFPRTYQPSGHLNVSRARETYLSWTSSYITGNTPVDLIVVAVAINFLLITDGSAVLRYST